jgi:glycosyltransferase involved in cell wall biosynthesis
MSGTKIMSQEDKINETKIVYSLVIPVYGNAQSIPELLTQVDHLGQKLEQTMEVLFVVDGSPDNSEELLKKLLPDRKFPARLVTLSRNFGSFAAIKTGFQLAQGSFVGVMAADLQEPPELILELFSILKSSNFDVAVGKRESRNDPKSSKVLSSMYWKMYRSIIQKEMPKGGVDIFATTRDVALQLVNLNESNSSLVGLLMWVGYRRAEVPYVRLERIYGKSGWTNRKKLKYMFDSIFSFTSLPISLILTIGFVGTLSTFIVSIAVFVTWLFGGISVPGYAAQMLVQLLSSGSLLFAMGILGTYIWRTYENSKSRPTAIVSSIEQF